MAERVKRPRINGWLAGGLMVSGILIITAFSFFNFEAAERSSTSVGRVNATEITLAQFRDELQLQAVRNHLRGQPAWDFNQAAVLNRLIGDILLLQGAGQNDIDVSGSALAAAVDDFLSRNNLSQKEFQGLLQQYGANWESFQRSMRDYLIIGAFAEDVVLEGVEFSDRGKELDSWISDRYNAAEIQFDEEFLEAVNSDRFLYYELMQPASIEG